MTRAYRRGKSVHDVFSMVKDTQARDITTQDRIAVLRAVLALGIDDGGYAVWRATGINRWTATGIAGAAGWPRRDLVEANLRRLRA